MKKINESQLLNTVSRLREHIAIIEAEQKADEGVFDTIGQAIGTAGGALAMPARAGAELGKYIYNNAGQLVDKATGAIANAAGQVAQGAKQGWQNTDPAKLAQAVTGGGAGSPSGTTLKTPQEIMAFQKANGLTPDGIAGPKTQAAMKAKGVTSAAPAAPAAPKAPAAPTPAASLGGKSFADANKAAIAAGAPAGTQPAAAPAAPAAAPQGSIATDTTDPLAANNQPKPAAGATPAPAAFDPTGKTPAEIQAARNRGEVDESIRYDDLQRIVSLVHYR